LPQVRFSLPAFFAFFFSKQAFSSRVACQQFLLGRTFRLKPSVPWFVPDSSGIPVPLTYFTVIGQAPPGLLCINPPCLFPFPISPFRLLMCIVGLVPRINVPPLLFRLVRVFVPFPFQDARGPFVRGPPSVTVALSPLNALSELAPMRFSSSVLPFR